VLKVEGPLLECGNGLILVFGESKTVANQLGFLGFLLHSRFGLCCVGDVGRLDQGFVGGLAWKLNGFLNGGLSG